jgi:hypothetical protein
VAQVVLEPHQALLAHQLLVEAAEAEAQLLLLAQAAQAAEAMVGLIQTAPPEQ